MMCASVGLRGLVGMSASLDCANCVCVFVCVFVCDCAPTGVDVGM